MTRRRFKAIMQVNFDSNYLKINILIGFLLVIQVALGQVWNKKLRFGVKSGVNISNMLVSPESTGRYRLQTSPKANLLIGGYAQVALNESFSLMAEMCYTSCGATVNDLGLKYGFDYLLVPVVVKYTFERSNFFAIAGSQTGFLLKSTYQDYGYEFNITKSSSKIDWGVVFGAGIAVDDQIRVEIRKNIGFTNVSKDANSGVYKNRGLFISLGYLF